MIIYNPTDGLPFQDIINPMPKHCFLMTRLGQPVPEEVTRIKTAIIEECVPMDYQVIDANRRVTGRDFLLKIWKLIAATPLSIGVVHQEIPRDTQNNIYYELGIAQALGKETLIVKCENSTIPSDFIRTEFIEFNDLFRDKFSTFLNGLAEQAESYEMMADMLENNPVLSIDYYKRAYLINGEERLKVKTRELIENSGFEGRAKNSIEYMASSFANH